MYQKNYAEGDVIYISKSMDSNPKAVIDVRTMPLSIHIISNYNFFKDRRKGESDVISKQYL